MMIHRSKTMVCGPREMNQAVLRHGITQTCAHYVQHHESFLLWPQKFAAALYGNGKQDLAYFLDGADVETIERETGVTQGCGLGVVSFVRLLAYIQLLEVLLRIFVERYAPGKLTK